MSNSLDSNRPTLSPLPLIKEYKDPTECLSHANTVNTCRIYLLIHIKKKIAN